MEVAETHPCFT